MGLPEQSTASPMSSNNFLTASGIESSPHGDLSAHKGNEVQYHRGLHLVRAERSKSSQIINNDHKFHCDVMWLSISDVREVNKCPARRLGPRGSICQWINNTFERVGAFTPTDTVTLSELTARWRLNRSGAETCAKRARSCQRAAREFGFPFSATARMVLHVIGQLTKTSVHSGLVNSSAQHADLVRDSRTTFQNSENRHQPVRICLTPLNPDFRLHENGNDVLVQKNALSPLFETIQRM
jgi:hypothetical protein